MNQIKQHLPFFHVLSHGPQSQCDALTATSTKEQISALGCVCLNMLNGFFILSEKDIKTLQKHRKRIHVLASKSTTLKTKKKLLRGKFLKHFLKIILPKLETVLNGK
jgi:hypothetical protein